MTTFVTFRQFCTENQGAAGFKNLSKRLYKKTLANGTTEDVPGVAVVDAKGNSLCMMALSKELYNQNATGLASMANKLNVCKQEYLDKAGNQQVAMILCTGGAEAVGEMATFSFA